MARPATSLFTTLLLCANAVASDDAARRAATVDFGSMSAALEPEGPGLGLSSFDVGLAGAIYVAGACIGAVFFGQLTDRYGRKKLFLIGDRLPVLRRLRDQAGEPAQPARTGLAAARRRWAGVHRARGLRALLGGVVLTERRGATLTPVRRLFSRPGCISL